MRPATLADLTNILTWSKTAKWFHHSHDTFRFEPVVTTAATPILLVSHDLLKQLHPDLPATISALIAWCLLNQDRAFSFNSHVSATVDYYLANLVEFTGRDGKIRLAKGFTVFQDVPNTPTVLWLRATSYAHRKSVFDSRSVTFITDYGVCDMEAHYDDMTERYPGWQQRWLVAKELGMSTADQALYALSKKPVELSVVPTKLTFYD